MTEAGPPPPLLPREKNGHGSLTFVEEGEPMTRAGSLPPRPPDEKYRHGCLTVWLYVLAIGSVLRAMRPVSAGLKVPEGSPPPPTWANVASILLAVLTFAFVIALFRWKKWGFWGICATFVGYGVIYGSLGFPPYLVVGCLVIPVILYGVLRIGQRNKGWRQLD